MHLANIHCTSARISEKSLLEFGRVLHRLLAWCNGKLHRLNNVRELLELYANIVRPTLSVALVALWIIEQRSIITIKSTEWFA
jgi:hypothetical protein